MRQSDIHSNTQDKAPNRFSLGTIIISICVILDQLSKLLVELYLPFQNIIKIMPSFALFRTWNEGVAFSFLSGYGSIGLVILACFVVCLVIWLWRSSPPERHWLNAGYALIIGGAIGNIIDRGAYGHVIDFIMLYYQQWSFAIFNIADCFISIGVALIIIDEIRDGIRQKRQSQKSTDT